MRPHDDITTPEPDPVEVLHHVRESAARWQETAERIARQRDRYYDAVKDIDIALCRLDEPHETLAAIEDIVERATLGIAT